MKIAALLLLASSSALASPIPFGPEIDARFTALETKTSLSGDVTVTSAGVATIGANAITGAELAASSVAETKLPSGAVDGLNVKRVARATYDVSGTAALGVIGAHGLGVTLPAKAIIVQSWIQTVTQFVDGGSGTVALSCEDANNILPAGDITGVAAGITAGAQTGAAAQMTGGINAACEITATVAGADQTAGKLILFVEYVVGV